MNPIAFDFTLIAQMILFLLPAFFIGVVIYFFMFVEWKRKKDIEISAKLDHIVDLLEKKNS